METQLHPRSAGLSWQQVDDEVVILDLASSNYLALNGSGALLWRALASGATATELTDVLVAEFEIGESTARADVETFLADCVAHGLVE